MRTRRLKRRETTVAVIRAAIAYAAFSAAIVLSVAQVTGGFDKLTTVAGASFMLILAAFAVQRLLTDVIAGLMIFVERWYYVGDAIAIPTLELQGVVEDVSLRRRASPVRAGSTWHTDGPPPPTEVARSVLPGGAWRDSPALRPPVHMRRPRAVARRRARR